MLKNSKLRIIKNQAFKYICKFSLLLIFTMFILILSGIIYKSKDAFTAYYVEIPTLERTIIEKKTYPQIMDLAKNKIKEHIKKNYNDSMLLSYLKNYDLKKNTVKVSLNKNTTKNLQYNELNNTLIKKEFNLRFLNLSDSFFPEEAGIKSSIIGSVGIILIMLVIVIPFGIGAAIYLEEFAKKNYINSFIEVSMNNLAAVPSIIYGLLGLMVFINYLHLPRSSMLVGGIVLALLSLPSTIIITRQALKEVPYQIKQAAYGLGATRLQVLFHHTLPYSMPSIITAQILGVARAIGESAPLLIIGMAAFVYRTPSNFFDTSTALPLQIFSWSKSPQDGFIENAAVATLVLLFILLIFNLIASYIRDKFKVEY